MTELIDVNVTLGQWPTRRSPCDEPQALADKLASHGVVQAWAGSFEGLFHADLAKANERLAELCRTLKPVEFLPFGSINPTAPSWEQELRRCIETHGMRGIRLHPNYHGYTLEHPAVERLLHLAAEREIIVELPVLMEDERMMHPLLRTPAVDLQPLPALVKKVPAVRIVLLNAMKRTTRGVEFERLMQSSEVYVEPAMLEGVGGIANLLATVPLERMLFGSHAPCLYFESALLKLQESALPKFQLSAVTAGNARRLLPKR